MYLVRSAPAGWQHNALMAGPLSVVRLVPDLSQEQKGTGS